MAGNTHKEPKEMSAGAKYALIGTIMTAVIGLLGTVLTLYFNYREKVELQKIALWATQTAEARQTQTALAFTPTSTAGTPTAPSTLLTSPVPTSTHTPTITSTYVISGEKYCVDVPALNVRAGPGLGYAIIGGIYEDNCIYFDGRLEDLNNQWVRISQGQAEILQLGDAWVYGGFLRPQDFERLPVVTRPPLPYSSPTPAG